MADASTIKTVAVLGTGTIGASWASFYAAKGLDVRAFDSSAEALENGLRQCSRNLARLEELGLTTPEEVAAARDRVNRAVDLADLVAGADVVHESVAETYEVKKPLFRELDALTGGDVILASSSSGLLMSEIQNVMTRPRRALIAHPFNPPHLIPLVELVAGDRTDAAVVARAKAFFEMLGKVPVVLNKEVPGHIANRLAAALWREAINLVADGVATVEDVDKALCAGPGLRWALMGQHLIYHLGGGEKGYAYFIEHIGKTFEEYWRTMEPWTEIPEDAKRAVVQGVQDEMAGRSLAELAEWRDSKLAGLLEVIYGAGATPDGT